MLVSKSFFPTLRQDPSDAQIPSHRLMLRAGMIQQLNSGIYSWLPLGTMVLQNICTIIRKHQALIDACEIIIPTIQPADLWKQSGRYDDYGKEMLRITDRHNREMLYGPTAEEVITHIGANYLKSYKDLPQLWYQIHWKFRDEIRPRFGVMRGREFLMKDGYTFNMAAQDAKDIYEKIFACYLRSFADMGLKAIALRADTGPIGGDMSHEFHVLAQTGESAIYYDQDYDEVMAKVIAQGTVELNDINKYYAVADEMHDPQSCDVPESKLKKARGIEVGHIFNFGDKYTKAMNMTIMDNQGKKVHPLMGSYGIGVSRLVAAIIECNHDDAGIIWPLEVTPFHVCICGINMKDSDVAQKCQSIYEQLRAIAPGIKVLFDDSDASAGEKFTRLDLLGIPLQVFVGPRAAKSNMAEVKIRRCGTKSEMKFEQLTGFIRQKLQSVI